MQARFVSLRVTETWKMVEGRNVDAGASAGGALVAHEVDSQTADPRPLEPNPTAGREPFPVD